jgi:hypothetical protein
MHTAIECNLICSIGCGLPLYLESYGLSVLPYFTLKLPIGGINRAISPIREKKKAGPDKLISERF